jgi:hypothetical protein
VALFSAQSPRCPAGAGGDGVVNFWDGENKKRLQKVADRLGRKLVFLPKPK